MLAAIEVVYHERAHSRASRVEATVLKPRAMDIPYDIYMRSMFFVLGSYPIEQTKQIGDDPFVFVAWAGRPCAYPEFIMPRRLIGGQNP